MSNEKSKAFLLKTLLGLLFLYVISMCTSMAAMEISSWSLVFFFIVYVLVAGKENVSFYRLGVELPILLLVIVAALGLLINAPLSDFIYGFGRLRNFIVFFVVAFSLPVVGKKMPHLLVTMLTVATVVAVYGIWQHYSGIDLWRHSHRALLPLPWSDEKLYATVGFFNHHLTYAHSYAMLIGIPWAILLIKKNLSPQIKILLSLTLVIIGTSIVFTFGRGAWIAVICSLPLMAAFVNYRIFLVTAVALTLITGGVLATNKAVRDRAFSITAKDYQSNEERKLLWRINWQMFKDHPLIGLGLRQNELQSEPYYKKLGLPIGMSGHAHNTYLEFLATTGVLGFACYLWFLITMLYMTIRLFISLPQTMEWERIAVLIALGAQIAFHMGGLTQCNFNDLKVQHQLLFWMAMAAYYHRQNTLQRQTHS